MNRIILFFLVLGWGTNSQGQHAQDPTPLEKGLLPAVQIIGEEPATFTIEERMKHYKVPGLSIAIILEGKLAWAKGYGVSNTTTQQPVDEHTLFQAGSISKPVAAMVALTLVQDSRIDLEKDINSYLTRWKVPSNKFTQQKPVHLQGLLSHTAGMTVHGFPGYTQTDEFPKVEAVLNGEGNTAPIVPDTTAGSIWRYSGGGYTVAQLAVEEVAGIPFATYAEEAVLKPLGMGRSTYAQPLPEHLHGNASAAFDSQGNMAEGLWNNYPELAAAGLWTTPTDLAKFCIAIQEAYLGKSEKVLSHEMIQTMLKEVENGYALGLGVNLQADTLQFGHGGKNRGFTNNMQAVASHGYGIIIMTNADEGGNLSAEIMRGAQAIYQWGKPQQRRVERFSLSEAEKQSLTGSFRLASPEIEDYWVEVKLEGKNLIIYDPQEKATTSLVPTARDKFLDRDNGRPISFEMDGVGKATGFVYAGQFVFKRIKL